MPGTEDVWKNEQLCWLSLWLRLQWTYDVESSNEEEPANVTETYQSKPVSHLAADQSKLVSYTDSGSEEEDLHVDVNFDEPIDLPIN